MLDLVGHGRKLLRLLLPVLGDEFHVCHSKHPRKIGPAVALPADCRWGEMKVDSAVDHVARCDIRWTYTQRPTAETT